MTLTRNYHQCKQVWMPQHKSLIIIEQVLLETCWGGGAQRAPPSPAHDAQAKERVEVPFPDTHSFLFCFRNFSSVFWRRYWHYKYGNCYIFNSGKTSSGSNAPILKSNKPGPSHGNVSDHLLLCFTL